MDPNTGDAKLWKKYQENFTLKDSICKTTWFIYSSNCIDQLSVLVTSREKCVKNAIVFTQQTKTCVPAETLIISSVGKKLGFADRFPVKTESSFLLLYNKNVPFFCYSCSIFFVPSTYSRPLSQNGLRVTWDWDTRGSCWRTTQPMTIKKKLKFLHLTKWLWLFFGILQLLPGRAHL